MPRQFGSKISLEFMPINISSEEIFHIVYVQYKMLARQGINTRRLEKFKNVY